MSMYGLYQSYKINRPLTLAERKRRVYQGKPLRVKYFYCGKSVIRINSTYLETTGKFYKEMGLYNSFWVLGSLIFLGLITVAVGRGVQLIPSEGYTPLMSLLILSILFLGSFVHTFRIVLKEWFKWTHYPIRFNRVNKMVYVFRTDGTVLSAPWKDIYFARDREPGPLNEWTIRGHILDDDGETVLETFSLGVCEGREYLSEYWEFIRCYMEEDVVTELSELIVFCPPIEDRKEGYVFGLQNGLYMDSRLEWIFLPFSLLLNIDVSICRYITSQTGKIPQWPEDIQKACKPHPEDPINISAKNNPKNMWQLVFANQPYDVWKEKYDRMEDATKRIHEILDDRYGRN